MRFPDSFELITIMHLLVNTDRLQITSSYMDFLGDPSGLSFMELYSFPDKAVTSIDRFWRP
jgi:hypothetical protein